MDWGRREGERESMRTLGLGEERGREREHEDPWTGGGERECEGTEGYKKDTYVYGDLWTGMGRP